MEWFDTILRGKKTVSIYILNNVSEKYQRSTPIAIVIMYHVVPRILIP
jgi:hypothetical protein